MGRPVLHQQRLKPQRRRRTAANSAGRRAPAAMKQMSDKGLWIMGADESAQTSIYDMRVATRR